MSDLRLWPVGPDLYVSGSPKEEHAEQLRDFGITSMYCLSKKRTPEAVIQATQRWEHVHIPDGKQIPIDHLRYVVSGVLQDLGEGHTVLLHCLGGRNRSMLVAALVERVRNGWSGQEAYDHVKSVRKGSMGNEYFNEFLRSMKSFAAQADTLVR